MRLITRFYGNYYMPGTTTKLSTPLQVLVLWFTLEIFFLFLDLTVTEINIKKVQKQDSKKCKNMACQKVCKQGMDDIIRMVGNFRESRAIREN